MSENIFFIMPSMVCIVWVAIFLLHKRNITQNLALPMLALSTGYFFLYAFAFTPIVDSNYRIFCVVDMIILPLILALLASMIIFVHSHQEKKFASNAKMQWLYMPAIVEGSIVGILYYLIGLNNATNFFSLRDWAENTHPDKNIFEVMPSEYCTDIYRLFYFVDVTLLNILAGIMSLAAIIACILAIKKDGYRLWDGFRFLFKGTETTHVRAISCCMILILLTVLPLMLPGRTFIIQHQWTGITISILVSIELFFACHCESLSSIERFTFKGLLQVDPTSYKTSSKEEADIQQTEKQNSSDANAMEPSSIRFIIKTNTLIEEIKKAFDEDKVWLDSGLRLEGLATRLHINRNKLSVAIYQIYGKEYKSLVSGLRIKEAKRLMKEDPSATLEYVARSSGFKDARVFFYRFKELVGSTPTEWKMNKEE